MLAAAAAAGARLDRDTVIDPWGNRFEIVDYRDVQFTKAPEVLEALGNADLRKTEAALAELRAKGMF